MNAEVQTQAAESAPSGPARKLGMTLLKLWGGVYGVAIVVYIIFLASGSQTVLISDLKPNQRLWNNEVFLVAGERIEANKGDTISDALLKTIHGSFAATTKPGDESPSLTIYQDGSLYNLPFPLILGALNFLGLGILLYMLAGDALPEFLTTHGNTVREELKEARAAKAEADRLKQERDAMVKELETERIRLIAIADEEAKREYDYLLEQRKEESERFLIALEHHLGAEIHAAAERLKFEVAERAVAMAKEKLQGGVGETIQSNLVAEFTKDLKEAKLS